VIPVGFAAPRRTYSLEFEGDEFDGLIVKVRPPTVGEALDNMDLAWMTDDTLTEKDRLDRLYQLYTLFSSRLVSWNVECDGTEVPATLAGLLTLDNDFGIRIVRSWLFETSMVPRPLDESSTSGVPSVEFSIPMDETSAALAS